MSIGGNQRILRIKIIYLKNNFLQEEKKQQALVLERQMMQTQEREAELQRLNDENKRKLLDSLAEEESKKEAEIAKFQKLKDEERKLLNDRMSHAEQQSDCLIKELMESNQRFSDPSSVMQASVLFNFSVLLSKEGQEDTFIRRRQL